MCELFNNLIHLISAKNKSKETKSEPRTVTSVIGETGGSLSRASPRQDAPQTLWAIAGNFQGYILLSLKFTSHSNLACNSCVRHIDVRQGGHALNVTEVFPDSTCRSSIILKGQLALKECGC